MRTSSHHHYRMTIVLPLQGRAEALQHHSSSGPSCERAFEPCMLRRTAQKPKHRNPTKQLHHCGALYFFNVEEVEGGGMGETGLSSEWPPSLVPPGLQEDRTGGGKEPISLAPFRPPFHHIQRGPLHSATPHWYSSALCSGILVRGRPMQGKSGPGEGDEFHAEVEAHHRH